MVKRGGNDISGCPYPSGVGLALASVRAVCTPAHVFVPQEAQKEHGRGVTTPPFRTV